MIYLHFLVIPLFAILNRARGSQLFGLTNSTTIGRIVSMGLMALLTSLFVIPSNLLILTVFGVTFVGFLGWAIPAWDEYWSAEIGNDPVHSKGWGVFMMLARQSIIIPTFITLACVISHPERAYWSLTALLYELPYYILGAICKTRAIEISEYVIGSLIGFTVLMIMGA